ncbi:hypothetical protein [Bradyrhizobium stylosanthis]|uniref:Uncharacterized protein n=1 Tax=Bradyrhizobium stylosanthis TaxID=1803665 RepID=A0A560DJH8_9BRAD|nr:hypothetical protein [Bradyrhizobium stylosanthis]TWA97244.1 hypothetical protein FBZ96_106296 [Bradyrhizobium stylosanthis]
MMMNCMNTGVGALTVGGIRLADAAITLSAALLIILTALAAVALARFCFDLVRRFRARPIGDIRGPISK